MKTLLIDAENKRIVPHEIGDDWRDITKSIGCERFEVATYFDNEDVVYADEEGRINGTQHYFSLDGNVFAGNGLVVGTGKEGESIDHKSDELDIAKRVTFLMRDELPAAVVEPRIDFGEWL